MTDHIPDTGKMVSAPESLIDLVLFERGYDRTEGTSRAILSALAAAGMVVVPVEPTREQINDGAIAVLEHRLEGKHQNIYSAHTSTGGEVFAAYRAMLAAAKEPAR